jgi:putative glycerol-1-phosphate prenyltransferase
MVGGGIRSAQTALELYNAGADMIVVGNAIEKEPGLIKAFCAARDSA